MAQGGFLMMTCGTYDENRTPDISVIVPVYNAAETLERCVSSLLAQTFGDFELILVDDGSTDASLDICNGCAASDGRVRVLCKPNGGVSSARNLGLDNARGRYVAFCDSDDYADADWLRAMRQAAEDGDMVICGYHIYYEVTEKGKKEEDIGLETNVPLTISSISEILEKTINARLLSFVWNKLFIRSWIEKASLRFDETCRIFEDELFVLEYLTVIRRVVYVPHYGYNYFFPAGFYSKYDFAPDSFIKVVNSIYGLLDAGTGKGRAGRMYPSLPSIVYWCKIAVGRYSASHTFRQSAERIRFAKKLAGDFHSGIFNHLTLRILHERIIYLMFRYKHNLQPGCARRLVHLRRK